MNQWDRIVTDPQVHDTWNARVLNSYGTTEAGFLGSECDSSAGIHIAEDMIVFEAVDEQNRPVPDGVPGAKVIMTNLFNRVLPLIRYEPMTELLSLRLFGSRRCSSRDDNSLGDRSGPSRTPVGWCGCHGDDAGGRQHRASRHGRERKARSGSAYCLTYFVTPRSCASAVYTFPVASIAMPSPIAPSAAFGAM